MRGVLGKQLRGRGTRLRSVSGLSDLGTEVRLEKVERCQGGNSKHPNGLQVRRSHPLTQPLSLHSFHSYPPSLLLFRVTLAFPGWIFIYLSPSPSLSLRKSVEPVSFLIAKILLRHGLSPRPPPLPPARCRCRRSPLPLPCRNFSPQLSSLGAPSPPAPSPARTESSQASLCVWL